MMLFPGQTFVVVRDSDDLGMDRGTRGTVEHVYPDGRIDLYVPRLDAVIARLDPAHPDIAPRNTYATASVMLDLWAMPWSPRALRFATWQLSRALRRGCDVLESPRVMESMRMATESVS